MRLLRGKTANDIVLALRETRRAVLDSTARVTNSIIPACYKLSHSETSYLSQTKRPGGWYGERERVGEEDPMFDKKNGEDRRA